MSHKIHREPAAPPMALMPVRRESGRHATVVLLGEERQGLAALQANVRIDVDHLHAERSARSICSKHEIG
jgi:hypothetical protein